MRQTLTTITAKLSVRTAIVSIIVLFAVSIMSVSVWAWGPSRSTFTMAQPATYVTFNSITDNPSQGDERNFMRVREQDASNSTYTDDMALTPGKRYVVMIFYHNNAASNFNADGSGIAHGAYARAEVPAIVSSGKTSPAEGYVGASNANPTSVYDEVNFENKTSADIALRYVPGSTNIHNFGSTNNAVMPDTILSSSGVKLGYDSLNGDLPGCNDYAGYVTFVVQADQPNFTFSKQVRVHGSDKWSSSVTATPGTRVDYLLSYENTGTTEQDDVTFKDDLPDGLKYVPGSSRLTTENAENVSDGIEKGGLNIGDYSAGSGAFLVFSATVENVPCSKLVNTAAAETDNGYEKDSATVITGANCTLPTTGPVEVVSGLLGVAAITFGVVYFFKSRRELDDKLSDVLSHPVMHNDLTDNIHKHN
jgi:uncharacterized repeat protein (TIGR01451 family)